MLLVTHNSGTDMMAFSASWLFYHANYFDLLSIITLKVYVLVTLLRVHLNSVGE